MDKIILHSTGCPQCRVLTGKINKTHLEYEINNDINKMEKLGINSVPVLQVGDNLMNFKEAISWINNQKGE